MATTLRQRIEWIVEHRHFRSMRELSKAAGLSAGTLAVSSLRADKGKGDLNSTTLLSLARVARVNPEWLATGKGTPDDSGADNIEADRYQVARQVVSRLVVEGVCSEDEARRQVGAIAFQGGPEGVSASDLYGVVMLGIMRDRGMLTGVRVETAESDDDL